MIQAELIIDTDDDVTVEYSGVAYSFFRCLFVSNSNEGIYKKLKTFLPSLRLVSRGDKAKLKEVKGYLKELANIELEQVEAGFYQGGNRTVRFHVIPATTYDEVI